MSPKADVTGPNLPVAALGGTIVGELSLVERTRADSVAVRCELGRAAAAVYFLRLADMGVDVGTDIVAYLSGQEADVDELKAGIVSTARRVKDSLQLGVTDAATAGGFLEVLKERAKVVHTGDEARQRTWWLNQIARAAWAASSDSEPAPPPPPPPAEAPADQASPGKAAAASKKTAPKATKAAAPAPAAPESARSPADFEPLPPEFAELTLVEAANGLAEVLGLSGRAREAVVAHLTTSVARNIDPQQRKAGLQRLDALFMAYRDSLKPEQKSSKNFATLWGVISRLVGFGDHPVSITAVALALSGGREDPIKEAVAVAARRVLHFALNQNQAEKARVLDLIKAPGSAV